MYRWCRLLSSCESLTVLTEDAQLVRMATGSCRYHPEYNESLCDSYLHTVHLVEVESYCHGMAIARILQLNALNNCSLFCSSSRLVCYRLHVWPAHLRLHYLSIRAVCLDTVHSKCMSTFIADKSQTSICVFWDALAILSGWLGRWRGQSATAIGVGMPTHVCQNYTRAMVLNITSWWNVFK